MGSIVLMSLVCIGMQLVFGQDEEWSEPKCYSRFDYDHKVLTKLVALETTQVQLKDVIKNQQDTIETLRSNLEDMKAESANVLRTLTNQVDRIDDVVSLAGSGTTYVRWGRTDCPSNGTELVYDGYAGGSHYKHKGGAANYLCLPKDPIWGHFEEGFQGGAGVFGSEYEYSGKEDFFGRNVHDSDVPCAVCRTKRSSVMMLPARNECYDGWTLEYHGYLTAGYSGHDSATEFVCMDMQAEPLPGGQSSFDGRLFYMVEAQCGALRCPPYVANRELTCAFCSK